MSALSPGTLWLVPAPLDLGTAPTPLHQVLPQAVMERAAALQHWVVEDAKSARALLKRVGQIVPLAQPLQALHMAELPKPPKGGARPAGTAAEPSPWLALLAPALQGHDLGLLSEAGLPAVADPGSALVAAAHAAGVPVQPLAGPSSLMLALAASGLNGQSFAFVGYLPQEAQARAQRIRELEAGSRQHAQTQLAIETPYRNSALLQALVHTLQPGTVLSVSCGLTIEGGHTHSATVAAWRRHSLALPDKLPSVFAWLAVG